MKNLIIFDCFGVICSEIAPTWFARHFEETEAKRLKAQYFSGADRGETDIDTLIARLAQGLGFSEAEIRREWGEIFSLNRPLLDYIRTLREDHHVALLSNAPVGLVERIFDHYDLEPLFDRVFISSHYRMAKPDREFYLLCTDTFRGQYDRAFMIDDNMTNLEGLEEISITPIRFTSNEEMFTQLERELKKEKEKEK